MSPPILEMTIPAMLMAVSGELDGTRPTSMMRWPKGHISSEYPGRNPSVVWK